MKSYVEREIFHETAVAIWADAVDLVARVSSHYGNEVRCHELARAARGALQDLNARKLTAANAELLLYDGMLGPVEHSWIVYHWRNVGAPRFILDVYCPGRLPQVQLIHEYWAVTREYERGPVRDDVNEALVQQLTKEMQT